MGLSWEHCAGDMAVRMREVQARLGVRVPMALSLSQSCAGTGLKHSIAQQDLNLTQSYKQLQNRNVEQTTLRWTLSASGCQQFPKSYK